MNQGLKSPDAQEQQRGGDAEADHVDQGVELRAERPPLGRAPFHAARDEAVAPVEDDRPEQPDHRRRVDVADREVEPEQRGEQPGQRAEVGQVPGEGEHRPGIRRRPRGPPAHTPAPSLVGPPSRSSGDVRVPWEHQLGRVQIGRRVDLVPALGGEDHGRQGHTAIRGHLLEHGLVEEAGAAGCHMPVEAHTDLTPGLAREAADVDRHEVVWRRCSAHRRRPAAAGRRRPRCRPRRA